ncbi:Villin headpiece domain-containing protein [Prochlorococcus marinus]|uniref:Villin headpiece domain-containing protein n=1 Tax=Prochlorococcus marinus TaxID=1219 RepID=UPI0022B2DED7|nr:Villin headpiece domain-containing protein [Prochlorococcus marinus]
MKKSPRKTILAMSFFVASILLSSCSSSIKSESNPIKTSSDKNEVNFKPASDEDIFLYRQIGISYLCMARQIEVEFPKAISLAAKNYALLISSRHGGLIKELGKEKIPEKNIYNGAILQLLDGAIKNCPDMVPEEDKNKFLKTVEQLNQKK